MHLKMWSSKCALAIWFRPQCVIKVQQIWSHWPLYWRHTTMCRFCLTRERNLLNAASTLSTRVVFTCPGVIWVARFWISASVYNPGHWPGEGEIDIYLSSKTDNYLMCKHISIIVVTCIHRLITWGIPFQNITLFSNVIPYKWNIPIWN